MAWIVVFNNLNLVFKNLEIAVEGIVIYNADIY
jgi:hypothetical protein